METVVLRVEGMSCSHCERAIKTAVGGLKGVDKADMSLAQKTVTVNFDPAKVTIAQIKEAIKEEGYKV